MIYLKNPQQIECMRKAGALLYDVLCRLREAIKPGMSTAELDVYAEQLIRKHKAIPSFLDYNGYPASICTSINEEVCHGIPADDVALKDGDIVNVDVSTIYNSYFSDSSRMFCIGTVSKEKRRLVDVARECVELGLQEVKPWGFLGDMGQAVHDNAKKHGYSVVREVGGHGVGIRFHEEPFVSYVTKRGTDMLLVPGMIFTIEPMINMGKDAIVLDKANGWTIRTADGAPSAQWEIMVLVTEDGHEVLAY